MKAVRNGAALLCAAAMLAAGFVFNATAQDGDLPSGDEIVQNVNARDDGTNLTREMKVTMTDKRGKTRVQLTKTFRRYFEGEKRSAIFYVEPANIKDTGFLTYDYLGGDKEDDQWLYIPELRRVRRISSSNRGDYYLGTDMTYEDMKLDTRLSTDDYNWTTLKTEEVNGKPCYVIEGIPVDEDTAEELGYGRYRVHVDAQTWLQHKTEAWDVNGNALKTIVLEGWKQVDGVWVVSKSTATNHKTKHSTIFEFTGQDVTTEIPEDMFTERALKRGV